MTLRIAASEARDSEKSKGEASTSSAGVHPAKELDEQLEKLFAQQTTSDSLASLAAFRNSSRMQSRYILCGSAVSPSFAFSTTGSILGSKIPLTNILEILPKSFLLRSMNFE